MLNRSASLAMSTCILKALPGKLDIKRHSLGIFYLLGQKSTEKLQDCYFQIRKKNNTTNFIEPVYDRNVQQHTFFQAPAEAKPTRRA